jgi:hypothetical protein
MKMTRLKKYLPTLVALVLAPAAVAQLTSFQVIDYPGSKGTIAYAMNGAGAFNLDQSALTRSEHE